MGKRSSGTPDYETLRLGAAQVMLQSLSERLKRGSFGVQTIDGRVAEDIRNDLFRSLGRNGKQVDYVNNEQASLIEQSLKTQPDSKALVEAITLEAFNATYKLGKWQHIGQLEKLVTLLEKKIPQEVRMQVMEIMHIIADVVATLADAIQDKLDASPNVEYASPELPILLRRLDNIEDRIRALEKPEPEQSAD